MHLLVTGSQGLIGRWTVKRLLEAGHTLRTIDQKAQPPENGLHDHLPGDIRDLTFVRRAMQGVEAVVHLAAIPFDVPNSEELIFTTNLQGTWNILLACVEAGVKRVVNFSSINALGHAEERPNPAMYLPVDDDVPHYKARAYNTTKHLGEELCQAFANAHGLTIASLRPTAVLEPQGERQRWWDFMPEERKAFWSTKDFWSYVDVRDVAEATLLGLTAPLDGHAAFLLAADDSSAKIPTTEVVAKYYPHLPWPKTSPEAYLANDPYRSLLDCSEAKRLLGWQPKVSIRDPESGYKFS